MKRLLATLAGVAFAFSAWGQTSPNWPPGYNPQTSEWNAEFASKQDFPGSGSGSVLGVSVVAANGFGGTVTNPTTTPAITITTSVLGLAKGVSGGLAAAVAGVDYLAPNGIGSALTGLTYSQLPSVTANSLLGSLAGGTAAGIAFPSCSGGGQGINWTAGVGPGCVTFGGGGGGGTPGGSNNSAQYRINSTTFGGISLTAGQLLVGSAGAPTAQTPSGDCTVSATAVFTCLNVNGVPFGSLATVSPGSGVAGAVANALNGTGGLVGYSGNLGTPTAGVGTNLTGIPNAALVNSAITIAGHSVALGGTQTLACADLTTAGTACAVNTGTTGAVLGLLNANLNYGGIDTFLNNNIRITGSSTGYVSLNFLGASASNRQWNFPDAAASPVWYPSASPPLNGQCPTATGVLGQVSWGSSCGSSGSFNVTDGFGSGPFVTSTLTLNGTACAGSGGSTACSPSVPPRLVGPSTNTYTIQASDMGNTVILQDNAGGTLTIPVQGTGLWGNGQTVDIHNESTGVWTIVVTSGTGSVIIEPSNPAAMPAMVNNIPSILYVNSDGTNLHPWWGGTIPNGAYTNQAQAWTAPQRTNYSTPTISTATFTPAIGTSQNYRINLVHAACPCTLANPSGTLVAGQQGVIEVAQSSTGSDLLGTLGSAYQYPGGVGAITLSTGPNAVDYFSYAVDSTATHFVLGSILLGPTH